MIRNKKSISAEDYRVVSKIINVNSRYFEISDLLGDLCVVNVKHEFEEAIRLHGNIQGVFVDLKTKKIIINNKTTYNSMVTVRLDAADPSKPNKFKIFTDQKRTIDFDICDNRFDESQMMGTKIFHGSEGITVIIFKYNSKVYFSSYKKIDLYNQHWPNFKPSIGELWARLGGFKPEDHFPASSEEDAGNGQYVYYYLLSPQELWCVGKNQVEEISLFRKIPFLGYNGSEENLPEAIKNQQIKKSLTLEQANSILEHNQLDPWTPESHKQKYPREPIRQEPIVPGWYPENLHQTVQNYFRGGFLVVVTNNQHIRVESPGYKYRYNINLVKVNNNDFVSNKPNVCVKSQLYSLSEQLNALALDFPQMFPIDTSGVDYCTGPEIKVENLPLGSWPCELSIFDPKINRESMNQFQNLKMSVQRSIQWTYLMCLTEHKQILALEVIDGMTLEENHLIYEIGEYNSFLLASSSVEAEDAKKEFQGPKMNESIKTQLTKVIENVRTQMNYFNSRKPNVTRSGAKSVEDNIIANVVHRMSLVEKCRLIQWINGKKTRDITGVIV